MDQYKKKSQFLLDDEVADSLKEMMDEENTCFNENRFYDKKKENSEDNMPLEISDEELIDMEPELLLSLQKYLKERRANTSALNAKDNSLAHDLSKNMALSSSGAETNELIVIKSWSAIEAANANFEEVEQADGIYLGARITQDGRTYIARNWKLTEQLKLFISLAIEVGFPKLWRTNHPLDSYLLGNENYLMGCHHISCSRTHNTPWIFALGAECFSNVGGRQIIKEVTFNKIHGDLIRELLEKKGGKDMYLHNGRIQPGYFKIQRDC